MNNIRCFNRRVAPKLILFSKMLLILCIPVFQTIPGKAKRRGSYSSPFLYLVKFQTGYCFVNMNLFETPPNGAGLNTVTLAVPAEAISAA
jgi:hypothetical protein